MLVQSLKGFWSLSACSVAFKIFTYSCGGKLQLQNASNHYYHPHQRCRIGDLPSERIYYLYTAESRRVSEGVVTVDT